MTEAIVRAMEAQADSLGPPTRQLRRGSGVLSSWLRDLRVVLFPHHYAQPGVERAKLLEHCLQRLQGQVADALADANSPKAPNEVVQAFAERLPQVRQWLIQDLEAAYQGDPACLSRDEVLLCYPGFEATYVHRLAHELYRLEVPIVPRILAEIAHGATGIDIHPGAQIGGSFFIDHGTGVVIGETCRIGERVRLYQGVTLGAKRFPRDEHGNLVKGQPRHPIVGDEVVIYAGATILGRVSIGSGSSIGGNVWLTEDVPPGSRITQARATEELFMGGMGI